jgi:hypothetical protein
VVHLLTQNADPPNSFCSFRPTIALAEGLATETFGGLLEEVQSKVFEYCSDQGWRMLENDVETVESEFEETKRVGLRKGRRCLQGRSCS